MDQGLYKWYQSRLRGVIHGSGLCAIVLDSTRTSRGRRKLWIKREVLRTPADLNAPKVLLIISNVPKEWRAMSLGKSTAQGSTSTTGRALTSVLHQNYSQNSNDEQLVPCGGELLR
ncbi:hypothetical protein RD792_000855 [Penstemon davidsonii]|uniref:Uncharacterized protein n=1 Tax=Penstemon davidsonii TaxID=160366 RepID=A0ABR0DN15_9LAMI|nr:hypothetical protein RD792_000855 [Penstemon davidsonii]